jgi:hypothetical protein
MLQRKSLLKVPFILMAMASVASSALGEDRGRGSDDSNRNASANGVASTRSTEKVVRNGPTTIKGNIWTRRHVYYVGDELDIRVQFPRGDDLLESGAVDAHVVVFASTGSVSDVPVPSDVGAEPRKFFRIESVNTQTLPEGQYQLGLVITVPDGDATVLEDWYGGFRGLLDSEAIIIAKERVDGDTNRDGELDDDEDGDGISGEEEDETDDDSPRRRK